MQTYVEGYHGNYTIAVLRAEKMYLNALHVISHDFLCDTWHLTRDTKNLPTYPTHLQILPLLTILYFFRKKSWWKK